MNTNNYATLEQAKRMKELGYPQDTTDCVWSKVDTTAIISTDNKYELIERSVLLSKIVLGHRVKWYAAPNAQEIELDIQNAGSLYFVGIPESGKWNQIDFGKIHHAQTRASAYIWQKEQGGKR
jgi:hypothetical protein